MRAVISLNTAVERLYKCFHRKNENKKVTPKCFSGDYDTICGDIGGICPLTGAKCPYEVRKGSD